MTRANPKVVGGFIIGGLLLLLLAVAALVSGKFFTHSTTMVSFFPESVRGLQIGSPVTFRGVPLGQVTAIEAYMVNKASGIDIEVTYQLNLDRIHDPAGTVSELRAKGPDEAARFLTGKGLRAELQSTSLVTGQLYIDLDFHPETPPRTVDIPTTFPQIPTAPTKFQVLSSRVEKFANALSDLPYDEIARNLSDTLTAFRDLARSPEVRSALAASPSTSTGRRSSPSLGRTPSSSTSTAAGPSRWVPGSPGCSRRSSRPCCRPGACSRSPGTPPCPSVHGWW